MPHRISVLPSWPVSMIHPNAFSGAVFPISSKNPNDSYSPGAASSSRSAVRNNLRGGYLQAPIADAAPTIIEAVDLEKSLLRKVGEAIGDLRMLLRRTL